MAEYVQVVAAGTQAGVNGFRAVFGGANQSDVPQLQAWDNELGTTAAIQALVGTTENGDESFVCAASSNDGNGDPGAAWATGLSSLCRGMRGGVHNLSGRRGRQKSENQSRGVH